ncbi:MAG: competence/damage-inducible protein A [Deltaproteobacteria bacterium]|nr:competence/damage-inducible protein A [Deltaproteobacteria bacterium]
MKIEVITIGDEILSGNIVDTNFAWIAEKLWSAGHQLHGHSSVRDEPEEISRALLAAVGRSEAALVTGGLGPTTDDITLEVAAKAFSLPMVMDQEALQNIRDRFQKIGRAMTPNNEKQALLLKGSRVISNTIGTAPGCQLHYQGTEFFFMPGVPREMKQQFEETVFPWVQKNDKDKRGFYQKVLRCFGKPEATIGHELEGIDLTGVDLAYRVSFPEILLKVSAWGKKKEEIAKKVGVVEKEIRKRLGPTVYAEGDEPLGESPFAKVVGELLVACKATLAVAESCTGGFLASLITDVPGSSRYFERGVVTYSNKSKTELLRVPEALLKTFGAVSSETASAMALGIRKSSGATYGIGITGIAGPEGGTAEKVVGTVFIGLATPEGTEAKEFHFPTNRDWFKRVAAFMALDLLRRHLLKLS